MSEPVIDSADKLPVSRRRLPWGCIIPLVLAGAFVTWLIPSVRHAREAARHLNCESHLNQMQLAFHNYHNTYGCFPPAYIADADGKPMHSWRVLILPFIDQVKTYEKYDFDEPWNGPNNQKLAGEIYNQFFHCPSGEYPEDSPHTNYAVIMGVETPFPGSKSSRIEDFKDGLENTILIVEIDGTDIPWMEPRDIKFDEMSFVVNDPSKPGISSPHPAGAHVVFADSISAYHLQPSLRAETLRSLITIAGGESVTKEKLIHQTKWTPRALGE